MNVRKELEGTKEKVKKKNMEKNDQIFEKRRRRRRGSEGVT